MEVNSDDVAEECPASAPGSRQSSFAPQVPSWKELALRNLQVPSATLYRGMPVTNLLRNFATVLSDRAPTEAYFELSRPVDRIDVFVSHNWSSPRWKKFLVLAFHFNLLRSIVIAVFVAVVTFGLTVQGALPVATALSFTTGNEYHRGFLALPLGMGAFVASIFFSHELDRLPFYPFKRRMVWLDRTCVHQTRQDKKEEGIQCLAAFLARSEDLIVLYSDTYMTRLWTVYELASWLLLHRGRRILLRPLQVPCMLVTVFLGAAVLEVIYLVDVAVPSSATEAPPLVLVALLAVLLYPFCVNACWQARKIAEEHSRSIERVREFRLSDAHCAHESDRRIVQKNILAFMRLAKLCDDSAEDADVLSAFEVLVQNEVPTLMKTPFGRVGVPYSWAVVTFFFPRGLFYFDLAAAQVLRCRPTRLILLRASVGFALVLGVGPLIVAGMLALTRKLHFRRASPLCRRLIALPLGALVAFAIVAFVIVFHDLLTRARDSDAWLGVLLLSFATLAIATFAAYRP